MSSLRFDSTFWDQHLPGYKSATLETRLHLILSLVLFLSVSIQQLLLFMFTTDISAVKRRVGKFMGFTPSAASEADRFYPSTLFNIWHNNWPSSRAHLHNMIQPCLHEMVLEESNRLVTDPTLKVKTKEITVSGIRNLLKPEKLLEKYRDSAPVTFELMSTFAASPNKYRKGLTSIEPNDADPEEDDLDFEVDKEHSEEENQWWKDMKGFQRNPIYGIMVSMSMLAFTRNRATNVLPLLLGLFFKVSGTSSRVMKMLSNAGVCVSGRTIERLKGVISQDAIQSAVELMKSGKMFVTIFDNINVFLRKFQQRITNLNGLIHATNCAIISLNNIDIRAEDLSKYLALRGKRSQATSRDILPTNDDDSHMISAFTALIAQSIYLYCPGAKTWENRSSMHSEIVKMMPYDRPLSPSKTDTRPFGVFDVNEGSKKGIVDVLKAIQERSTLSEDDNLRGARRTRGDDTSSMNRLEYPAELSALFHFALQASHMIMRVHYGHAVRDPSSLAAHKGLLGRTWDVNKPNYAAAKSLIRHSLIARILHCVMVKKRFRYWSQLEKWKPNLQEIQTISGAIQEEFTTTRSAAKAQDIDKDDVMAHSIYFMRDALTFLEFEHAVSHGDAGRVLRVLKYWSLAFRGAGQHNYARECVEILLKWTYETTPELRLALESSWFVNRWGEEGRFIASDLYLEQLNYWVKCIFIALGNGVTIEYIMEKGSANVEALREVVHLISNFFGDSDRARRSKESSFMFDLKILVENMASLKLHSISPQGRFVAAPPQKSSKKSPSKPQSAIIDVTVIGAEVWNAKFQEFLSATTFDEKLGYPIVTDTTNPALDSRLSTGTAIDRVNENPITHDEYEDIHGNETSLGGLGAGALGGGDEFATGAVDIE
ncbi:hypothetical protein H0H93_000635 [Arthromyces matolae]|nr:hypothetical protein H0H93_000635 [Arthromyces matolae]